MAVALFYNTADLTQMVAAIQAATPSVNNTDRTAANRIITAIGTIQNLPIAPIQYQEPGAANPDTRLIVLPTQSGNKQNVLDLFNRMFTARSDQHFLRAIWKDMRGTAVDPWVA